MILFGASGHAKVILDILILNGVKVKAVLDDNPNCNSLYGVNVLKNDSLDFNFEKAIISVGNNTIRKKISEKYNFTYTNAIHPSAAISPLASLGTGNVVMANASINPSASIGNHCIINTGSIVEHDCVLSDFVHISPNAALAGNVFVGEGTQIGIGAAVIQGIKIGKWVKVGAGAVIIKDIPDYAVVVGNPGKIIKIKEQ